MKKMFHYFLLCFVTANLQAQTTSFVNGVLIAPLPTQVSLDEGVDAASMINVFWRNLLTDEIIIKIKTNGNC